jgi:hypothetical protein
MERSAVASAILPDVVSAAVLAIAQPIWNKIYPLRNKYCKESSHRLDMYR